MKTRMLNENEDVELVINNLGEKVRYPKKHSISLLVMLRFRTLTCTAISRVRIPTTARQSGSEVGLVVSTFITLIQYVYIYRLSTDGWNTGWRQMSLV